MRSLSIHSWFLYNSLGITIEGLDRAGGFEVKVWRTGLLFFSFPSMNSKYLMIYNIISIRFIVSFFQSFLIADTRAEYLVLMFISIVA